MVAQVSNALRFSEINNIYIALAPMWSIAHPQFSSTGLCLGLDVQFGSIVDLFAAVLVHHLHPRYARAQMTLLGPQISNMPFKSHVIVLFAKQNSKCLKMNSFKNVRELLLLSYVNNVISDREFVLLYDAYQSKNPDFNYQHLP